MDDFSKFTKEELTLALIESLQEAAEWDKFKDRNQIYQGNDMKDLFDHSQLLVERLENQNKELGNEKKDLELEMEKIQSASKEKESVNRELEVQVFKLSEQVKELESFKEDMEVNRKAFSDEKKALADEIEEGKKREMKAFTDAEEINLKFSQELEEEKMKNLNLNEELSSLVTAISSLEEKVKVLESQKDEIEESMNDLKNENSNLVEEKEQLVDQNSEYESELMSLKDRLNVLEGEKIILIEKEKNEAIEKNKEHQEEISRLTKELENEQSSNSILKATIEKLEENINEAESLKSEIDQKTVMLSEEALETKKREADALEQIEKANEEILCLTKTIEEEKDKNTKLVNELSQQSEKLKALQMNRIALQKQNRKLLKENSAMYEEIVEGKNEELSAEEVLKMFSLKGSNEDLQKYYFLRNTLRGWLNSDVDIDRLRLYENVISDMQELLDFYCLLTGVMIKSKNNMVTGYTQFECEFIQSGDKPYNGYKFLLNLDYGQREISYSPIESNVSKDFVPPMLKDPACYNVNNSCHLLKGILGTVM